MTASITERLAKTLSRLSEQSWIDPLTANFWLGQLDPILSINEVKARVAAVQKENGFLRLTLQPNLLWQGFRAGQHVLLTTEIDGRRHSRSYSIYSSNQKQNLIELGIRSQGRVSSHLFEHIRVGDIVQISQAQGNFVLPDPLPEKMLFIAGGSGITPIFSMIQTALQQKPDADIALLYYAPNYTQLPLGVEIQNLAFAHSNFKLKFSVTQTEPYDADLKGHFVPDHLNWLNDFQDRTSFICGPAGLIAAIQHHWQNKQLPPPHHEYFKLNLTSDSATQARFEVELADQHKTLEIKGGDTLLNQLEQSGVAVKSGCRMGICHECRCTKTSGVTRNLLTQELSREPGPIQLCVHRAESNITLAI
ncbi:MAG TPA: ferredoxin reductase [Pseudomonadales bacterium]|nr:ferredoxin reductase [Pseudomonadales bacterium]